MTLKKDYPKIFEEKLRNIEKLISTPNFIRNTSISILKGIINNKNLTIPQPTKNAIDNGLQLLSNIQDESIKNAYEIIYNQCCILAVSAFSDTIQEYFTNYVKSNYKNLEHDEKIRLSLKELQKYDLNLRQHIGDVILEKDSSINFQNLTSIIRSFNKYCKKDIKITEDIERKVIFYQQCRHLIAHQNSRVNKEFLEKVSKKKANIKNFKIGEEVKLNQDDWDDIKRSFLLLLGEITKKTTIQVEINSESSISPQG